MPILTSIVYIYNHRHSRAVLLKAADRRWYQEIKKPKQVNLHVRPPLLNDHVFQAITSPKQPPFLSDHLYFKRPPLQNDQIS